LKVSCLGAMNVWNYSDINENIWVGKTCTPLCVSMIIALYRLCLEFVVTLGSLECIPNPNPRPEGFLPNTPKYPSVYPTGGKSTIWTEAIGRESPRFK
jgi:hypothetical protein